MSVFGRKTSPAAGHESFVRALSIEPVARAVRDGDGWNFLFDSGLAFQRDRALELRRVTLSGMARFAVVAAEDAATDPDSVKLSLVCVSTDGSADLFEKIEIVLDLSWFTAECGSPIPPSSLARRMLVDAVRSAVVGACTQAWLAALSSDKVLSGHQQVQGEAGGYVASAALPALPARTTRSARVPSPGRVNVGRYKWLKWGGLILVLALLAYGLSGLVSRKSAQPDPFAGIDPEVRKQIESAGVNGANNPAHANVTEQTLRSMGLDPGKAANIGCLAQ